MRRRGEGPLQWIEAFGFSILLHGVVLYLLLDFLSGFTLAREDRAGLPDVQITSIVLDPEMLARATEGLDGALPGGGLPDAAPTPGRDAAERLTPVPTEPEDGTAVPPETLTEAEPEAAPRPDDDPDALPELQAEAIPQTDPETLGPTRASENTTLAPGGTPDRAETLQPLAETLSSSTRPAPEPLSATPVAPAPAAAAAVPATPIRPRNPDEGILPQVGAAPGTASPADAISPAPTVTAATAPEVIASLAPPSTLSGTVPVAPTAASAAPATGSVTISPTAPAQVATIAPAPAGPAPPDPASAPAPSPATAPASGAATASAVPLTPQQESLRLLVDRIRGQLAEPCLVAYPRLDAEGEPELVMLAASEAAIRSFAQTVLQGFEPRPGERSVLVDPRQCDALTFVRANAGYPAFRLAVGLDQPVIDSGTELDGRIANGAGLYLSALLIDDNGVVQDLGSYLRFTSGAAQFRVPLTRAGPRRDTSQIFLVIGTDRRPATLDDLNGTLAEDFFAGLQAEIGSDAPLALIPFDVR